ncbi:MAG TPA: hypothetical protein VE987_12940 [Polyangiaceae bacterium]|nr:hypothetical protein [Polyangiaceae bacterium]
MSECDQCHRAITPGREEAIFTLLKDERPYCASWRACSPRCAHALSLAMRKLAEDARGLNSENMRSSWRVDVQTVPPSLRSAR